MDTQFEIDADNYDKSIQTVNHFIANILNRIRHDCNAHIDQIAARHFKYFF